LQPSEQNWNLLSGSPTRGGRSWWIIRFREERRYLATCTASAACCVEALTLLLLLAPELEARAVELVESLRILLDSHFISLASGNQVWKAAAWEKAVECGQAWCERRSFSLAATIVVLRHADA